MPQFQRCTVISSALAFLALWAGSAAGAARPAAEEPGSPEVPPLRCWWRTDRIAVHVGQQLQLTLTCAAAQSETASVVPDWDRLQPEVVDLAPFEVVAGTRSEDVVAGSWRYSQFEYTLRLTGEEFFGQDVPLPPLEILYSISVNDPGGRVQQGRERTYVLPPLPMKILSLVPARADDIEDAVGYSFAVIERRRAQAAMAFMVGCGLLAAGALCLILFLSSLFNSMRVRRVAVPFCVADWRVVAGCRSALRQLASAADRNGWTDDRVGEALALLRVLGAVAVSKPVRQRIAARDRVIETGEWMLSRLSLRRPRIAISASATAAQLREHASQISRSSSGEVIENLAMALAACSDVRYGREDHDSSATFPIGQAIHDALNASGELLRAALLPPRLRAMAARYASSGAS